MKKRYWLTPLFLILGVPVVSIYCILRGSYPHLCGKEPLPGLKYPVEIDRDKYGIPTVHGASRADVARATGFIHAQDRFFQMDLMRRMAAGELSELLGSVVLELDKERRIHGFRKQAEKIWPLLSPSEHTLITAYAEGVNSGLQSLDCKPFEYFLLNANPQPWTEEDSLLVGLGLFFDLQDPLGAMDRTRGLMKATLPPEVYTFFIHNGSAWEAPLDQSEISLLSIPGSESFQYLQKTDHAEFKESAPRARGSNQWAVQGSSTADGHSLLACDMHLNLFVPNIWYRLGIEYKAENLVHMDGVTLPGTPFIAAGSNRHIAWGFTNGYVDTTDLVLIDLDPANPNNYITPDGSTPFEERIEEIKIKGSPSCFHKVLWTRWGPIDPKPFLGKPVAIRWIAHDLDAFNFRMVDLETVTSVKNALKAVPNIRLPVLNFMVADAEGHIGWSYIGGIPKREGYHPELPVSFTDGTNYWNGTRTSTEVPFVIDPPSSRLWTANNRVLEDLSLGFDQLNGIRAYQIQKRLASSDKLTINDMKAMQLDDEAIFFERWQSILLEALDLNNPAHKALYPLVADWDRHCSSSSKGYFWIRTFRDTVKANILKRILAPCFLSCPDLDLGPFNFEEPIYLIASQKPAYLSAFNSWELELRAAIDEMLKAQTLDISWGKTNLALIQHPLSSAIPLLNRWLDMPKSTLAGDWYVPRVAGPSCGASLRMVVSPGHEEEGLFNVPCGQSGHPLSPHYRDQHAAWLDGNPTPFLPGPAIHELKLVP